MNCNNQTRSCHPERSEGSLCPSRQTLSAAKSDNTLPILVVKIHHRGSSINRGPTAPIRMPDYFVKGHISDQAASSPLF